MPVVGEQGFHFRLSHRGKGYATGPTITVDHNVMANFVSVHVGLAQVQTTTASGPLGAAIGIMKFGDEDLGPDPANWTSSRYGSVRGWTIAMEVTKGDMSAWEFFHVWQ